MDCAGQILIVDDDEGIREAVAEVLIDEGLEVATAADGQQALRWLADGNRPCLILLDLMMPIMDGRGFRAAQSSDPRFADIPVVVITAGGQQELRAQMAVQGWLGKPIEIDVLLDTVGRFCSRARAAGT
jgi:CheY-like chemotaxis protein